MKQETKWQQTYRGLFALAFAAVGAVVYLLYITLAKLADWGKNA